MTIKAYKTAIDYLRKSTPQTKTGATAPGRDEGFAKLLTAVVPKAEARPGDEGKAPALTASDYLARPLPALRIDKAAQAAPQPSAVVPTIEVATPAPSPEKPLVEGLASRSSAPPLSRLRSCLPRPSSGSSPLPVNDPALRQKIDHSVSKAADKYDLPKSLIHGVIKAESDFQPRAVSADGAQGLMQLMPGTARDLGVRNAFDIDQNIDGGARYLRQMLDMFDGNLKKALAAYNAGPATVQRHNGIPPYAETRDYVQKVITLAKDRG